MIGGLMARVRASMSAAATAIGLRSVRPPAPRHGTIPKRFQPRSASSARADGRSPRRDTARQAAAQAKRKRKDARRARDWMRCFIGTRIRTAAWPYVNGAF